MPFPATGQKNETRHIFGVVAAWQGITFLSIFAVLLPSIVACGILYRQALSAPYQDDYGVILAFAETYQQAPTLKAKLVHIATDQANEYKLCFEHAVVASELELTHHLNFLFLTGLGNLFLMPIGYLLWRIYQPAKADLVPRLLAFLPISLVFFSLTYWENLNWATTDLVNIPVVFFSLLAIYLLSQEGRAHLLLACLAAALAAACSANGFLLGPVGLLVLLPRRAYASSLLWCASFAAPLAAYLYRYTPAVHPVHPAYYLTRPFFFLAFLGCGTILSRWPAALVGVAMLAIVRLAIRSRYDKVNPAAYCFMVWILATALMVGWVRGAGGFSVASRYSIYSILLLTFCYAFLADYLSTRWSMQNRRRFYVTCLVCAVTMFSLANLRAYRKLGERRRMVLTGIELYRLQPEVNSPMIDPLVEKVFPAEKTLEQSVLTRAIQEHIYTLPRKEPIR